MTRLFSLLILFLSVSIYSKPNVIIILTDDLGWGDVSYHGGHIPTPNIDALAKNELSSIGFMQRLFAVQQEHHY